MTVSTAVTLVFCAAFLYVCLINGKDNQTHQYVFMQLPCRDRQLQSECL